MPSPARRTRLAITPLEDRKTPTAGNMDPSFGSGTGIVTPTIPNQNSTRADGVVVQPDGKIVMAGTANSGVGDQGAVFRLNFDGTLDTSFNGTGYFLSQFGGGNTELRGIALQSDGKIVVTGTESVGGHATVVTARLDADGTLDSTFGNGGSVTTDFTSGDENGWAVAVQPDGKIVVVGDGGGFMFLRFNPDGTLDTSFDADGIVAHNPGGIGAFGRGVTLQPDGKIIGIGGGVEVGSPNQAMMLIRLNADGSYDTSFDTDGIVTTLFPGGSGGGGGSVGLLSDGRIAAAGSVVVGSFGQQDAALFNPNGSLDTSFGQGGKEAGPAHIKRFLV